MRLQIATKGEDIDIECEYYKLEGGFLVLSNVTKGGENHRGLYITCSEIKTIIVD